MGTAGGRELHQAQVGAYHAGPDHACADDLAVGSSFAACVCYQFGNAIRRCNILSNLRYRHRRILSARAQARGAIGVCGHSSDLLSSGPFVLHRLTCDVRGHVDGIHGVRRIELEYVHSSGRSDHFRARLATETG